MEDMEKNSPPQSQDQSKDDRPVFERLKSLADGNINIIFLIKSEIEKI